MKLQLLVVALFSLTTAATGRAQVVRPFAPIGKEQKKVEIPKAYMPPPGMCRIWLDDVPPAQQPAPTDCATAIKKKPQNGRVIFGESLGPGRKDSVVSDSTKAKKPPESD